ncbi:hypothetical protein P8452_04264 [Trifolium repens]|nr:hypothetical protein P8452_04264 [Trifolium repens]
MSFLSIRQAIQTSILSKRWKNLWKQLPNLIAKSSQFSNVAKFRCFLNKFLTNRDHSNTLQNIVVDYIGLIPIQILGRLFKYGASHNVETIAISTYGIGYHLKNFDISNIFRGCFIKYLNLSFRSARGKIVISHSLDLPELTHCLIRKVSFSSYDENNHLEPFSSCKKLSILIIDCCDLIGETNLFVSNENLYKLILRFGTDFLPLPKIQMDTPSLKFFTFVGLLGTTNHNYPLFKNDLKFLEEVNLQICFRYSNSKEAAETLMSWLKKFHNINSMTLASSTAQVIEFIPNFPNIEDVCFRNMVSLVVKIDPYVGSQFSFGKEVLEFLVKKSRCNEAITTCEEIPLYYEEYQPLDLG